MNYLEMVQQALREASISGSGPTSISIARGIEERFVSWVKRAWLQIQEERRDYRFMRESKTFSLSPGKATYSMEELEIDNLDRWDFRGGIIYSLAEPTKKRVLQSDLDYDDYLLHLSLQSAQTGPVTSVMVMDGTYADLLFWPTPTEEYSVSIPYYRIPDELVLDSDVPALQPANLHWAIVWRALLFYAYYDGAVEIAEEANEEYNRYISMIDARYKPSPRPINLGSFAIGER